jgi:hypothetical protein
MTAITQHGILEQRLIEARRVQLLARMTWARSPNALTIKATQIADEELDKALDVLAAALRQ